MAVLLVSFVFVSFCFCCGFVVHGRYVMPLSLQGRFRSFFVSRKARDAGHKASGVSGYSVALKAEKNWQWQRIIPFMKQPARWFDESDMRIKCNFRAKLKKW